MSRAAWDPRIPDKEYFRIGEVAEIAGVEPYVLRFWESEFARLRPSKTRTSQRVYSRRDVSLVLRIRDLLYEEGYTISGARRQLARASGGRSAEVPARTRATLDRVRREAEELLRLVEASATKLARPGA
ncbi:MAG TPA: MerR family transcriptional regulator [Kofleriaceae bacterium]|nr:MerR family transcriptional regulator [Kofleriaceae bacterium]